MDMSEKRFFNSFPYKYKIDVNDSNWARYQDGWAIYKGIKNEAIRMGITFTDKC